MTTDRQHDLTFAPSPRGYDWSCVCGEHGWCTSPEPTGIFQRHGQPNN